MKAFLLALLSAVTAILYSGNIYAQSEPVKATQIITGIVTDINGEPIAGAELSTRGWSEVGYTDNEGKFSIEVPYWVTTLTASSKGFNNAIIEVSNSTPVEFQLQAKKPVYGFANIVGGAVWPLANRPAGIIEGGGIPQFGLMVGLYRTWGGYMKIMFGMPFGAHVNSVLTQWSNKYDITPTITLGVIRRITPEINVFVGTGMGVNYTTESKICVYTEYTPNMTPVGEIAPPFNNVKTKQALTIACEAGATWHLTDRVNITGGVIYVAPAFNSYEYARFATGSLLPNGNHVVEGWTMNDSKNKGNLGAFVSVGINFRAR